MEYWGLTAGNESLHGTITAGDQPGINAGPITG
jgi:hypothetical protein